MLQNQLNRLAKGSLIYGLGGILNRFLSFLLLPLFTQYLIPEDYGIYSMLAIVSIALTGLFSLGTGNSMGICYFETNDLEKRRKIVWTTFFIVFINSLILSTVLFFMAPALSNLIFKTTKYTSFFYLTLATLAVQMMVIPFQSFLRMEEKAKTFIFISFIATLLTLSLNIYTVVYLHLGLKGMIISGLVVSIIILIISAIIVFPYIKPGISTIYIPRLIKIGYPSIFGLGAYFIIDWASRFFIQREVGLDELGLFSMGSSFAMIMAIISDGAFGSAWPPYFISFINKRDEAIIIFGKIFQYCLFLYGTISLVFFIGARPVLEFATTKPFHGAYTVVGLIAMSYLFKVCYLIMLPGIYFAKKIFIITIIEWLAAFIGVGIMFLIVPYLHKEGAALGILISYFSLVCGAYFFGQKLLPVRYDWKQIFKFIAGFLLIIITSYIQFTSSVLFNTAINGLLFIIFIFYIFHIVLKENEKKFILNYITQIRNKFFKFKKTNLLS